MDSPTKTSEPFQRSFSSKIYSSIRKITPGLKKSNKPKPFFTRLLLSVYEEQFYLAGGSFNSNYDEHKKKFQKEIDKVIQKKSNAIQHDIIHENADHEKKQKIQISLKIKDNAVHAIYMEVLYVISYRLGKEVEEDEDGEQIKIYNESALEYVRGVFGINPIQHNENLVRVRRMSDNLPPNVKQNSDSDFETFVNLMKIFIKYEIETAKAIKNSWNGELSFLSRTILSLHSEFLKLDKQVEVIARWTAFVDIHVQHRIDLKSFCCLLPKIAEIFPKKENSPKSNRAKRKSSKEEEFFDKERYKEKFLTSCEKLSKNFYKFIEKIHKDEDITILENILVIEKKIEEIRSESENDVKFTENIKIAITNATQKHLERKIDLKNFEFLKDEKLLSELLNMLEFTIEHRKKISGKYLAVFEK